MIKKLNRLNTGTLSTRPVKVIQFGQGNFLRAFTDWVIQILNDQASFNGDVLMVKPRNGGSVDSIDAQEGLYHVVINGIVNGKTSSIKQLITCVKGIINPYENFESFLKTGEYPELQLIFSNTTEAGIYFDSKDLTVDQLSKSFPGKLTQLLFHRFNHFQGNSDKAPIIIPCELIENNGTKLQQIVNQYIDHWNLPSTFAQWVNQSVIFCNTLVDRIVPGLPKENLDELQQELGFEDDLLVTAEPYYLWVIEGPEKIKDIFPTEKAGLNVKFVQDLSPYRTRKVRILNGLHTALVPVAYLYGQRYVREAIEDEFCGNFIKETLYNEIIPTLDLPTEELDHYAHDIIDRFLNPYIKHELSSIALNSISKFKVRVLPSIFEFVDKKGTLPKRLIFSLACLIQFYKGRWKDSVLPVNDSENIIDFFNTVWMKNPVEFIVQEVLSNEQLWDKNLSTIPGLVEQVAHCLQTLENTQDIKKAFEALNK